MINTSIRKMEYGSGYSKERLYNVHRNMIERCENHTNIAYKYYGGRGIKVCPEWHDYMKFREWAYKNGYDDSAPKWVCTIDRIDTNGDYTPNNCRWVDMKEQARNKRPYKNGGCHTYVTVNGIPRKKREVCEEYGISVETFSYRVNVKGMTPEEALTTPKMAEGRPKNSNIFSQKTKKKGIDILKRYKSKTHDLWIEIFDEVIPERYCVNIESWENGVMIDEIAIGKVLNLMECIGCSKDDIVDMATAHIDRIEPKAALGV